MFPLCFFALRPNNDGGNEDNGDLLQKVYAHTAALSGPNPAAGHANPWLPQGFLDTHRQVWVVACGATAPFSWVLVCTRFCLCPPRVCFPVLCEFWQRYGGVNGDLLQEGLCHTQMCCIQSPCPCGRPLLTLPPQGTFKHSSDSETQFLPLTALNAQTLV